MDEIKDLLHAVDIFVLDRMKDICMEKISDNNISIDNCLVLYQSLILYNLKPLELDTNKFIIENAKELLADKSFIEDVDENTLEMMLKSEDVCVIVSNESILFNTLVEWLAVDEEERKDRFCFVRLPMIAKKHFTKSVDTNPHLRKECDTCSSYLWKYVNYLLDGEKHELSDQQLPDRHSIAVKQQTEVFVLSLDCSKLFKFKDNDLQIADFAMYQPPPSNIDTNCRAVGFDGKCFYIFGEHKSSKAFYYDPNVKEETNNWQELPLMINEHDLRSSLTLSTIRMTLSL